MKTKNLALAAVFTALTAVFAQIMIPLPFTPVPFSMSVFAVYLTGALLPAGWAAGAQAAYLLLGAAGLPVFGGFSGGLGVLAGPTGGYLLVYPLMAAAVAAAAHAPRRRTVPVLAAGMLCALAVCYLGGSLWYCASAGVDWKKSAALTVLPFVPFDLLKIALCAPFAAALGRALEKARLLPQRDGPKVK